MGGPQHFVRRLGPRLRAMPFEIGVAEAQPMALLCADQAMTNWNTAGLGAAG